MIENFKVRLPLEEVPIDPSNFNQNQKEITGQGIAIGENRIVIETKILH